MAKKQKYPTRNQQYASDIMTIIRALQEGDERVLRAWEIHTDEDALEVIFIMAREIKGKGRWSP